jgi:tripartite-type tricarboxylate transporter receptor subunit TctC
MRNNAKKFWIAIFMAALGWGTMVGGLAFAQEKFPTKQLTFIISWSAGGGQDLTARALQPHLEKALGQPVIIINKPGGGASIGFNEIANSAPDGYTFGQVSPSINILKYTMRAGIDYVKFEPIMFGGYSPSTILVRKEAPWNSLKEFLDYARANPGKVRMGNSGYGAIFHISAIGMEQVAGAKFIHVPYKGTAPSIPALLGGHIEAIVAGITDTFHLIKGGKLKALGVAAPERSKFVPEAQTFKELGMDAEFITFYAWVGPKGIPKERVTILYQAFKKAIERKEFRNYCDSQGVTISTKDPEEFAKYLAQEDKKWNELITIGGIKPE